MQDDPEQSSHPSPISELVGVSPLLPGESKDSYRAGLQAVIDELGASTPLQVYIAEKIYDCLWWIGRYEDQKRLTLIAEMARQTQGSFRTGMSQQEINVREALLGENIPPAVAKTIAGAGHSIESLRQEAYARKRGEIMQLDQQIALQVKILSSFQTSYELAFNRKLNVERLTLQNALMRRDLHAIDQPKDRAMKKVSVLEDLEGGESKTARRK